MEYECSVQIFIKESYPIIKRNSDTGAVVLFTSSETGTLLAIGKNYHLNDLGTYSNSWCEKNFTEIVKSFTIVCQ